ncbi:MAG: S1 RNA-binding domain-containing protein [Gemmatimonadales bacterium]|nr:S1 RNA-binding domain-containing protein [Gemmatimonadales bacterium]
MTSDQNENPKPGPENDDLNPDNEESSTEFADLLASSTAAEPAAAKPGDKVTGTIIQIGDHDSFVDCGLRNELPISTADLKNAEGELEFQVGQEITAHVQKSPDGLKLALAINLRQAGHEALTQAYESGAPVEGKVGETNKGGFSVDLGGVRAFCPYSQIDVQRIDDPSQFVGRTFQFKILELSEDGRNVVVSRRALVEVARKEQAATTRASIQLGDVMDGMVTRLVPFGAFVDVGGIEGLVHISQISHQRVNDPADVLKEGQEIQVKVLEVQNLGQGRSERISLSLKALAQDPWPATATSLSPGNDVQGKVTRLVDFGVFVELLPGVEGLIHISELANRRVIHPREVLNEGETVTVKVLDVDLNRRRISLSLRQSSEYDED